MDEPVLEKTKLVLDALQFAHEHNLDINNKNDIQKILEALDPKNTQNIDDFTELLKNADAYMEMTAKEKEAKRTDLPN